MRLFHLLAWRPLRRRPLRALLAIVAVAAGTAMAVSILLVRSSVATSVQEFGEELSGPTELRVVGAIRRGGLEAEVADRVARTDGVAAAIPVVQAVTSLDVAQQIELDDATATIYHRNLDTLVVGVDCRAEVLVGSFGCTDETVADHGDVPLAIGPRLPVDSVLHTNTGTVSLGKPPTFAGFESLNEGRFVVFPLTVAQRIFDRGDRVDAVYVQPEEGVDVEVLRRRLDEVIGEQNAVLDAGQGPAEVELVLSSVLPLFSLIGLFGLAIGALLVYNTVTLSLEERRRELAVVGALGGTRRVVAWTALGEAAALGAVGGVVGAIGGRFVAAPIVRSISGFTRATSGIPIGMHVGGSTLVIGAVLGVLVAVVAAVVPTRRALRAEVAEELSGRGALGERTPANFRRRTGMCVAAMLVGAVLVVVGRRGGGLSPWQVPAGGIGFGIVVVSLLLGCGNLAPLVIRPLTHLVPDSPAGRLAVANLLRAPGRTGIMVVALAGATATAFVTGGYSAGIRASIDQQIRANMDGVAVSAAEPGNNVNVNLDVALPPALIDELAEVPGVAAVRRGSVVVAGAEPGELVSVGAWEDTWVLDEEGRHLVAGTIDPEAFAEGEAIVNTLFARSEGVRPGDTVALPTPTGMAEVKVQAVIEGGGPSGREVVIPWDLHQRLYGRQPIHGVNLLPEPGVTFDELQLNVYDAIYAAESGSAFADIDGSAGIPLSVNTPSDLIAQAQDNVRYTMLPFWTLQQGLLVVSFVAVLSTLLLIGVQRRREMGMLAAVGMTPWRLGQMVVAEAAVVGVVSVGLGVLGGIVTLWALLQTAPLVIGFSNPFRPDWATVVTSGGVAVVVAVLAAAWPARRAARTEVIPALRYE
jgi:putative ABC transport system permease protein